MDWNKVAFEELDAANCKKIWMSIQDRIRRFRILSDLLPDARTWVAQPWTNFYKSKDFNRHPDMPKKPLSMYMLFYSEMREEILKTNPNMSMPDVAKACSEKYQKLSDKKKAKYKSRCDDMRKEYDLKMKQFYKDNPQLKPVKPDKAKKQKEAKAAAVAAAQAAANTATIATNMAQQQPPQTTYISQNMVPIAGPSHHQPQPQLLPQMNNAMPGMTLLPPASVMATVQPGGQLQSHQVPVQLEVALPQQPHMQQQTIQPQLGQLQPQQQPQQQQQPQYVTVKADEQPTAVRMVPTAYPGAPERPCKPFELFFKSVVNENLNNPNFDRQSTAEKCRADWKTMKAKKKAKWIKKAAEMYREYEEAVAAFMEQNPGYVPPEKKNFLTQEDQKILDKAMGRPEKPPSSAYSLFSKEMLNHPDIKKFPSKDRMSQISERWKTVDTETKDK